MPSTWPITKPYPARRSGSVGCTSLATEPSCFVGPSDFGAGSRSNSLELEALLRRRRVAPERVERAYAEGVAAGGQVLVGLRRLAVAEARLGALLLELALEARGAADRLEAEARGPLRRVDLRLRDLRVRRLADLERPLGGLRVGTARIDGPHQERVAAGLQMAVGPRGMASRERRGRSLLLQLALEARDDADSLEAEARGSLARPDGGLGDQRVRQPQVTQHDVAGLVHPDAQRWGGRRAGNPVEAPPPVGLVELPVGRVAGRLDRGKRPPAVVDRRA